MNIKITATLFSIALFLSSCAQKKSTTEGTTGEIKTIPVQEFSQKINATQEKTIIDVRTPEELSSGTIPQAIHVDFYNPQFETQIDQLDKSKPIFIYCKSGGRSGNALEIFRKKGFQTVYNLQGGMMAWTAANMPISILETSQNRLSEEWSTESFSELIQKNDIVLVDYYAQWCAPCKRMKPALDNLEKKYAGKAKIVRLDIDKSPTLVQSEGITAIPTIVVYKQHKKIETITKELSASELEELLNN